MSRASLNGLSAVRFGYTNARTEGAEEPELLLDGFLDNDGLVAKALSGRVFIFLGYKGSGKTAIAEHVRLLAKDRFDLFVRVIDLEEFSYTDFKNVARGSAPQSQYATVWSWLLLLQLVESLASDESVMDTPPLHFSYLLEGLRALRLLPVPKLNDLVVTSAKRSFRLQLPKLVDYGRETEARRDELDIAPAVQVVQNSLSELRTTNSHIVFIDGLDEVLTQRELQFQSLAALMAASARLNLWFRDNRLPFKFVVLCRTDIFDRLPGANMNKLRRDASESLSWYESPQNPDQSRLIRLVNLRAKLSLGRDVNVFDEFLPTNVGRRSTRRLLLDHTRHTPRDVLQLFVSLQEFTTESGNAGESEVLDGLREYSIEYFLPELHDELDGYLDMADIDRATQLLTSIGSPRTTVAEMEERARDLGLKGLDVANIARVLFECSGLGMVRYVGDQPRFIFKYRNPRARFDPQSDLQIHPAALKALGIEVKTTRRRRGGRGHRSRSQPEGS